MPTATKSGVSDLAVMQTVLITGGSGLLGLNWAIAIRERSTVILGVHERNVLLSGVRTQPLDLESVDNICTTLESTRSHLVVHTAGLADVEACEAHPDLAHHINVDLAANVAAACARLGLPLVHISTDHLFSGESAFAEDAQPVAPVNVYAQTKAEAERRVIELHPSALVVRTNFFGWGPSYRRSFSDRIIDGLQAGESVTLFEDVFFTPIIIEALVHAVHDLLHVGASGVFHVVGDERISKYQFGMRIAERLRLDQGLIRKSRLAESHSLVPRPLDMSLSNKKACGLLGRGLGSVSEQLDRLVRQQSEDATKEVRAL